MPFYLNIKIRVAIVGEEKIRHSKRFRVINYIIMKAIEYYSQSVCCVQLASTESPVLYA